MHLQKENTHIHNCIVTNLDRNIHVSISVHVPETSQAFFLTYIPSSGTCALVFLRPLHVISNRKGLPFIPFLFRVPLRSSSIPTQTSLYWGISVGLLHRSSCCPRNRNTVLKTQAKWEQIAERGRDKCTQTECGISLFVKVASL